MSHIASGVSHTTGRAHTLNFRAATAVFGHLGIEWDLAQASEVELAELKQWIAYYRANRERLLSGDLVRVDVADPETLNVYGVVSPERDRATYFHATTARPDSSPRPRVRLPGLDPARRYAVRPVVVGAHPSGLEPAPWWGTPEGLDAPGELDPDGIHLPGIYVHRIVEVGTGIEKRIERRTVSVESALTNSDGTRRDIPEGA